MTSEFQCPACRRVLSLERDSDGITLFCDSDCPGHEGGTGDTELSAYLGLCYQLDETNVSVEDERETADQRKGDYLRERDKVKL